MMNSEAIKAILRINFVGFKDEIIEKAVKSISELEPPKSDDAIHRGDVLTAINDFCQCVEEYGAYNKLYDFVENIPSVKVVEKVDEWIPVSERLPEENGVYLACYEDATVLLDWFNGKWFFHGKNPAVEETGTIIAWMPLPEPYKAESEEV